MPAAPGAWDLVGETPAAGPSAAPPSAAAAPPAQGAWDVVSETPAAPPGPWDVVATSPDTSAPTGDVVTANPGAGSRYMANAHAGFDSTLAGAALNYVETPKLPSAAPAYDPSDPGGINALTNNTPDPSPAGSAYRQSATGETLGDYIAGKRADYIAAGKAADAKYAAMPSWMDAPGIGGKIEAGAAALAGQLAGAGLSPESWFGGAGAGGAIHAGVPVAEAIGRSMGVQGVVQGVTNVGAQGINVAAGKQDSIDPAQAVDAAGTGMAFAGVHAVAAQVVDAIKNALAPKEYPGKLPPINLKPENVPPEGAPVAPPDPAEAAAPAAPAAPAGDPWALVATTKDGITTPAAPAEAGGVAPTVASPAATSAAAGGPPGAVSVPAAPPAPGVPAPAAAAPPATPAPVAPAAPPVPAPVEQTATKTPEPAAPAVAPAPPVPVEQTATAAPPATVTPKPAGATTPAAAAPAALGTPPAAAPVATTDPNAGTVTTPTGRQLAVQYQVVPAASLQAASGDLQPRDRAGRVASDAQIQNISANLDPARLMRSTESDRGAPIVGPDNVVESGNGRVAAIRQAAQTNPQGYARYVAALQAAGHDTTGIENPVLIARRTTDLSPAERQQSVIEHNTSATQTMSAPEQAQLDGKKLTSAMLGNYDHTQPATSASNRGFVRDWVNTLPEGERNGVQDAQGNLSADGTRRLNGAMLARAYGDDKGVLSRGLESTDDETKGISGALTDAAPAFAKMRSDVEAGRIPAEFDTSKQLVKATDLVRPAREKRQNMSDILGQQDAFNPIDPVTERYVRAMYAPGGKRLASRPAVADVLRRYADEAGKQASSGSDLLGGTGTAKVRPQDALDAILKNRDAGRAGPGDAQPSFLGRGGDNSPTKLAADDRVAPGEPLASRPSPTAGVDRSPLEGVPQPDRNFNQGVSPYAGVFRDAGLDPSAATSLPIQAQVQIIRKQMKSLFGFREVTINPRQKPREVADQLADFYQNAQSMAAALGMPMSGISLDGRLTFTTKPYANPRQALGSYAPVAREITIPGRSNSFAHEWTHAWDHYLSDKLAGNPKAMRLLSETKGMSEGMVAGKVPAPLSTAEAFVGVMRAIYGDSAKDGAEAMRLQYLVRATKDGNVFLVAQKKLEAIQSDFTKRAAGLDGPKGYWADPVELVARAHEAYTQEAIRLAGGDADAIAKSDYTPVKKGDQFDTLYPQASDRARIFHAFAELHDAQRRELIHGTDPAALPPGTLDMLDPSVLHKLVPVAQAPGVLPFLKREIAHFRNPREQVRRNLGYDATNADHGKLGIATRAADVGRAFTYSIRAIAESIVHRQDAGPGRAAMQQIMDRIVPAEGIRSKEAAAGREIGPVFEQLQNSIAKPNMNKLGIIFKNNGLDWGDTAGIDLKTRDIAQEKQMLHHVLTSGDTRFPMKDGRSIAIPANVLKAAGPIRDLLNKEWYRNGHAEIDLGFAKNGYFPRMFNDHKVYGDRPGFRAAATELHKVIFEQSVGTDPEKLLEAYGRISPLAQDGLGPDVRDKMAALKKNIREQDRLQTGIDKGTSADPNADHARLTELRQQAGDIHDATQDQIRDAFAGDAADAWDTRINNGDPTSFDTRGPSSNYTQKRVLPPETDQIMRDYLITDASEALPAYFQQSARRIAFTDRFGKNGSTLEALIARATSAGVRAEEIAKMRELVEAVTGRRKSGLPSAVERGYNAIHAFGSIALMSHGAFASLAEPMAMMPRTGSVRATYAAWANLAGATFKTASAKQRAEIANAIGVTVSRLHDSVLANRNEGHYDDSPSLNKIMTRFYRMTRLTQLTNAQRESVMGAAHGAMQAWGKDLSSPNPRYARDAAAQFRDLGVPDAMHAPLASWLNERPGLPTMADLDTDGGHLWGHAVTALTDQVIQDPMRVDKPLMSQNPTGRLLYGLAGFNYAFFHNIIQRSLDREQAKFHEAYAGARQAGRNKFSAGAAAGLQGVRGVAALTAGAVAVLAGTFASTALREALLNHDKVAKEADAGTLGDYLFGLAVQRTGINGPIDPLMQAITGIKYQRDISSLTAGAQLGFILQNAQNILKAVVGDGSPNTNTAAYNAYKSAYQLFAVPAINTALSVIPGGPLFQGAYSTAGQALTSQDAGNAFATMAAGPKGSDAQGNPPPEAAPSYLPPAGAAPAKGNNSTIMGVPVGMADDVAVPAVKGLMRAYKALPGPLKIPALVAAGGAGLVALFSGQGSNGN